MPIGCVVSSPLCVARIARRLLGPSLSFATALALAPPAHATVALLQPAREAAANEPLTLTLLYTDDDAASLGTIVPSALNVTLSSGEQADIALTLVREPGIPDHLTLRPGHYRKIRFTAPWPTEARDIVRVSLPPEFGTAPMQIIVNRGPRQLDIARAERAVSQAATPAAAARAAALTQQIEGVLPQSSDALTTTGRGWLSRLSYYEPMYLGIGKNGDASARFQFSFKYRLHTPADPASKNWLDNLYFSYTQTSIWDLSAESKPFRDTSYQPRLFYYLADTGWRTPWFTRMGIAAGVGHESNGKSGTDSRSLNTAFIQPTWEFGPLDTNHLQISPKVYYYLQKSENSDIADYRGYVDLLVKYGSPNGWQLATTLRKGKRHWYGSMDTQLTYPLSRLLSNGWGGYLWIGYFNGYGEDLLDYNQRQHWIARVGVSIAR